MTLQEKNRQLSALLKGILCGTIHPSLLQHRIKIASAIKEYGTDENPARHPKKINDLEKLIAGNKY